MDAIVIEPCVSVRGCVLRTGSLGLDGGDVCGDSISPPPPAFHKRGAIRSDMRDHLCQSSLCTVELV